MHLLQTLLSFLAALGILVTFHEYGHYWVAKRMGVKILRFSIGFGRPLLQWRRGADQTEFRVAAIPLGGYVKMLDEREGEVAPDEVHRAFNRQPVGARAAIVAAGPLANLVLALLVYWLSYLMGVPGPRPFIDTVAPEGPAARAGLQPGDEILTVNGAPAAIWDNVLDKALSAVLDGQPLALEVAGAGGTRPVTLDFSSLSVDDLSRGDFFRKAGFEPQRPLLPARIGRLVPDEAAARAGLLEGDLIVEAEGSPVRDWVAWVDLVRENPDRALAVVVLRAGQTLTLSLTPTAVVDEGRRIGRIGAEVAEPDERPSIPMAVQRYGPLEAAQQAAARTWNVSATTLKFMHQMLVGRASVENLSGPLTIAQFAGHSARRGGARFLEFLGLVSVSLAVLNLLPVPLLDGGHLVYYLIESVARRPVPEKVQGFGQQVGLLLLLGLMGLALYNDLMRMF